MPYDRFRATARRQALRQRVITYKGGSCEICGYTRCDASLEFHHIDAAIKDFTISSRMTSFEAVKLEVDKCVLLCANCHREVHQGMHPGFLEREDFARGQLDEDV